ncbi:HYR domain-containing protein [Aureisphaera galaxeae]|uniref:HYR domain-containing protein n=1 Tax=Aureisphaera galaxeae TaxID=1538023 RepID=UPI0023503940|nr:HYR domain-containing protein [Aureisphaera galaxeae]MDC8002662.1 HYR domain-containing protein [Aureisphaera galaxeae]
MKKVIPLVFFLTSFLTFGQDTNPPTAVCTNFTALLDATGSVTIMASDVDGGSFDAEGPVTLSIDIDTFTCIEAGPNTVTLTATDGGGNTDTCMATVTVADLLAPTAICQPVTLTLDGTGNATLLTSQVDNGSSDNCGAVFFSLSKTNFTCADVGSEMVTLTVTDSFGNASNCMANITIQEMTEPVQANCQDITLTLDASGSVSIVAQDLDDPGNPSTGYSSCGTLSFSASQTTFDCDDVLNPLPTRELILTGVIGDTATTGRPRAIELYAIKDVPVGDLDLYGLGSANPAEGVVTQEFTFPNNGSVIPAGTHITIAQDNTVFTNFFGISADYVASTAADIDGNDVVSLFYNGTAVDTFGDINAVEIQLGVELGRLDRWAYTNGWAYRIDNTEQNGGVFDFDDATWAYSSPGALGTFLTNPAPPPPPVPPISGTGFPINTYTFTPFGVQSPLQVTLTIDDGNGNTDSCIANVTVVDNVVPTFLVMNITKTLDAMGNAFVEASELYTAEAVDNCNGGQVLRYRVEPSQFNCSDIVSNPNPVVVTAIDVFGNETSQTAFVTLQDTTAPQNLCANITVTLDANGMATITPADILGASEDPCGIDVQSIDVSTFDCSNIGVNNVVLTLTDPYGNTSTCTAQVTVQDTTDPNAICQDITVQLDASGNATITASQLDNGSNDACGIASVVADITSFSCSDIGVNDVVLTVTDTNGNIATCTAQVTVEDAMNPTAMASDISVVLNTSGQAFISGSDIDNGSTDNCTIVSLSVSPDTFTCSDTGSPVSVTLTVTDDSGNTDTATANVTVVDTTAPVANCQDITIQLDTNGMASVTAADVDGGSTVSCGTATTSIDIASFDCSNIGPNSVVLTVMNASGLTTQCTAVVTVEDTLPPTVNCQDITVILDASGNASILPSDVDAGSSDNCGIASSSLDISSFSCADVGTNTITLSVMDVNGNTASCTAMVTVLDDINPTAVCQNITLPLDANGNATLDPSQIDAGSSDFCGIASLSVSPNTFDCSNLGANAVTLTVTDTSGNTDTCTAIVTIEDDTDPEAVCQNITVQLDASGNAFISAADIDGGSTDACGIASISASNTLFNCTNVGSNTILLTVLDTSGNVDNCSAIVTVEDNVPPAVICQDITISLDTSGSAFITVADIDGGTTDACGLSSVTIDTNTFDCDDLGPNNVTLTATDIYGNTASCLAVVTITDTTDPTVFCPSNQTEVILIGTQFTVPDYFALGLATADDNCTDPITIVSQNPTPGTQLTEGTYTVSITAEDDSGNSESCNFQLIVDEVLGVEEAGNPFSGTLVPNPTSGEIYLRHSGTVQIEKITIYDLLGRVLMEKEEGLSSTEISMDVSLLPSAQYIVKVTTVNGIWIQQLIKE